MGLSHLGEKNKKSWRALAFFFFSSAMDLEFLDAAPAAGFGPQAEQAEDLVLSQSGMGPLEMNLPCMPNVRRRRGAVCARFDLSSHSCRLRATASAFARLSLPTPCIFSLRTRPFPLRPAERSLATSRRRSLPTRRTRRGLR